MKKSIKKSILLSKALYGKVRLEWYKRRGFVIAFRGKNEIFWLDYKRLKKIIEKFDEVVKIKKNLDEDKK